LEEKATKKNLAQFAKKRIKIMDPASPIIFRAVLFSDPTSEIRTKRERLSFFLEEKAGKKNLRQPFEKRQKNSGTRYAPKFLERLFR